MATQLASVGEGRAPAAAPSQATELFEKNYTWAIAVARNLLRVLPPCFEASDLIQEALLELWKRALCFEADNGRPGRDPKGTPFQAYAYVYIRGACLMSVRRRNWTESQHLSLATPQPPTDARGIVARKLPANSPLIPEPLCSRPNPEDALIQKREKKKASSPKSRRKRWLLEEIDKLSPVDAHLITRTYIDEQDLTELAQLAGVDRVILSRRLAGIVKRLKKAREAKK